MSPVNRRPGGNGVPKKWCSVRNAMLVTLTVGAYIKWIGPTLGVRDVSIDRYTSEGKRLRSLMSAKIEHSDLRSLVEAAKEYLVGYHVVYFSAKPVLENVDADFQTWTKVDDTYWSGRIVSNVPIGALLLGSFITGLLVCWIVWGGRKSVYLVDFGCCVPKDERMKLSRDDFRDSIATNVAFDEASRDFQMKVIEKSGFGQETYVPLEFRAVPPDRSVAAAQREAETVVFNAVEDLIRRTGLNPSEIDIVIVNCTLFCPMPSLAATVVNHFKLKSSVLSYNLGGMGCSASMLSVGLAKDILANHPNSRALLVSTENISRNYYFGKRRDMLITNCLFRMGCSAVLLSNRPQDRRWAKYLLLHTVRTHCGAEDDAYSCVRAMEDEEGELGVSISKSLMGVAGKAVKINLTALGPLVLPFSEKLRFVLESFRKRLIDPTAKSYIPDFTTAFQHFCIHAGGKSVLDTMKANLRLQDRHMEPSRATLYRYGNVSSASVWYELAYCEAKGRINRGDRVWQIAFGSGFKCGSVVWEALKTVKSRQHNPWPPETLASLPHSAF